MIVTLAQIAVFFGFIAYIVKRFGIITSISDSVYFFKTNERVYFTIALWTIALLNYFQPMDMYGAVASGMLFFTGVTINFKSNAAHGNIVHYLSAGTALLISVLGLMIMHGLWYLPIPIILLCGLAYYLGGFKYFVWWLEIIVFVHIMIGYLIIA